MHPPEINPDAINAPDDIEHLFIRIESNQLIMPEGIIPDRHRDAGDTTTNGSNPQAPLNKVGGTILALPLSGWLRHGAEQYLIQERDRDVCHPAPSGPDYDDDGYDRDLENGYHEKGACTPGDDNETTANSDDTTEAADNGDHEGCIIYEAFGDLNRMGIIERNPIKFSPVKSRINYARGEARANFIESPNAPQSRTGQRNPIQPNSLPILANLNGTFHIRLLESNPALVGLIVQAVKYLNTHARDLSHRLGGGRTRGAGVVKAEVVNPLYSPNQITKYVDRSATLNKTAPVKEKNQQWNDIKNRAIIHLKDRLPESATDDPDTRAALKNAGEQRTFTDLQLDTSDGDPEDATADTPDDPDDTTPLEDRPSETTSTPDTDDAATDRTATDDTDADANPNPTSSADASESNNPDTEASIDDSTTPEDTEDPA